MPADDEQKPGKPGGREGSGSEPREREQREPREPREPRLPLTELLKRGLSAGQAVSESLFPRELASSLASQLVDARHGLVKAIASEVGRFLRQADIASEMRKALAGLNVEAKIHLRFSEDERGKISTDVKVEKAAAEPKGSQPPPSGTSSNNP
jgi:hypothetical protein